MRGIVEDKCTLIQDLRFRLVARAFEDEIGQCLISQCGSATEDIFRFR